MANTLEATKPEKSQNNGNNGSKKPKDVKDSKAKPEPRRPHTLPTKPDPAALQGLVSILDGRWAKEREEVRKLIDQHNLRPSSGLPLDEARDELLDKVALIGKAGLQKGAFTAAAGGTGATGATITSLEMLGQADLSLMVKSGVQWGLWGGAIDALGTERHRDFVQGIIDLDIPGIYAMTERGHGSDVQNLETTATYDADTQEFIIHSPSMSAQKCYLGNAARHGKMAAVFAQLHTPGVEESHGVHCLVVPVRDDDGNPLPGVTIGDHGRKGGLEGVDNGTLLFDHVRVPREALLNRFGDVDVDGTYHSPIESRNRRFFTMLGTLIRGRIVVGAAAGAATRTSLALATKYATRRRQFEGVPGKEKRLIEHRSHRLRLLPRLARSYALALLQNQIIERLDQQYRDMAAGTYDPAHATEEQAWKQRELESRAAAVKVAATAHATDTIQECREACGGAGYMDENLLTIFKGDSDVFTTFEGDNTVLIQMVGKELITSYTRGLSNLSALEIVKFGVDNVSDILRRRTTIGIGVKHLVNRVSDRDDSSLFDVEHQMKLFEEREQNLLRSLVRRLREAKKMEIAEAVETVDRAQDHLIACAWARVDTLLLEALVDAEASLPEDSPARDVFEQIRDLFALATILEHSGWYQEQNILTGARTKAARAAVNDLVDSIAPWAELLVDAFKIPDSLLDVPMLTDAGVDKQ